MNIHSNTMTSVSHLFYEMYVLSYYMIPMVNRGQITCLTSEDNPAISSPRFFGVSWGCCSTVGAPSRHQMLSASSLAYLKYHFNCRLSFPTYFKIFSVKFIRQDNKRIRINKYNEGDASLCSYKLLRGDEP
jgi:hypothetical protein